jgi:hypothetical protein
MSIDRYHQPVLEQMAISINSLAGIASTLQVPSESGKGLDSHSPQIAKTEGQFRIGEGTGKDILAQPTVAPSPELCRCSETAFST